MLLVLLAAAVLALTPLPSFVSPDLPPPDADDAAPELPPPPPPRHQEDLVLGAGPLPPQSVVDPEAVLRRLDFLASPLEGARISMPDSHLPGAPREYRQGWHQGIDYYAGHSGIPIVWGQTPVLAAGPGEVVRADLDFVELTVAEREALLAECVRLQTTPASALDRLHGRQVWIMHPGGVLTRYSHLAGLAEGLREGQTVERGQLLGWVGNSGTAAAARGSREGAHLHFEIHLDGAPFWVGLSLDDLRTVLRELLDP